MTMTEDKPIDGLAGRSSLVCIINPLPYLAKSAGPRYSIIVKLSGESSLRQLINCVLLYYCNANFWKSASECQHYNKAQAPS